MNNDCLSCALVSKNKDTLGGLIAHTDSFEARQDYAVPIPGFIIISSKRHVQSVDAFTNFERHDFIDFIHKIRTCMRRGLTIDTVYMIQEEDSEHFHLWLFPRYEWMNRIGTRIGSLKNIMNWSKENLNTSDNIKLVENTAKKLAIAYQLD